MDTRALTKVTLFLLILVITYIVYLKLDFDSKLLERDKYYKLKLSELKVRDNSITTRETNIKNSLSERQDDIRSLKNEVYEIKKRLGIK